MKHPVKITKENNEIKVDSVYYNDNAVYRGKAKKDKIDNIKDLWEQIDYKTGFIEDASIAFKKSKNTLHNHWFARWFSVPKKEQDNVITFMQTYINLQNSKK